VALALEPVPEPPACAKTDCTQNQMAYIHGHALCFCCSVAASKCADPSGHSIGITWGGGAPIGTNAKRISTSVRQSDCNARSSASNYARWLAHNSVCVCASDQASGERVFSVAFSQPKSVPCVLHARANAGVVLQPVRPDLPVRLTRQTWHYGAVSTGVHCNHPRHFWRGQPRWPPASG
jgi:hypothetical protein